MPIVPGVPEVPEVPGVLGALGTLVTLGTLGTLGTLDTLGTLKNYFHAEYTGGPTRNAGLAPLRGRNFWSRPPPTSATYRLPS